MTDSEHPNLAKLQQRADRAMAERTRAARTARTRIKHDRWVQELREAGFKVTYPEDVERD